MEGTPRSSVCVSLRMWELGREASNSDLHVSCSKSAHRFFLRRELAPAIRSVFLAAVLFDALSS